MTNSGMDRQEKSGTKEFLLGAIVGGVVGAAAAIWFSQKPRTDIKEAINEHAITMKDKAESFQKTAITKMTDLSAITKEKTSSLTQTLSQQSSELLSKLNNKSDNQDSDSPSSFISIGGEAFKKKPKKMTVTAVGDERIQQMLSETKMAFDETERKLNQ